MNTTTDSPSSTADPVPASANTATSRCPYLYPNGKRCSLPSSAAHSGFCSRHSQTIVPAAFPLPIQNDSEDLSAELLPELSQFSSGLDINKFLARLLILITKGRVSPRRASVMAYVTNQLLHSHRAIARDGQLKEQQEGVVLDFENWPCPPDANGLKGPAVYKRAVLAGRLPDPRLRAARQEDRIVETNIPLDRPNR
jgi:hypothetical protein